MNLAFTHRELAKVREFLLLLSRRRGQLKKPIIDMVQWGQGKLDALPSREERTLMLTCLKEASEGKMFLEREYAQTVRA